MSPEQSDAAQHAYEQVLASSSGEGSYLAQLAILELGHNAERRGDVAQARGFYEQAAALEGPLKAEALLAAARVFFQSRADIAVEVLALRQQAALSRIEKPLG